MDDDLRGLEHRLRAAPTAEARLALARGLERVGRRDEAHVVLAQDPFDAQVTAALASHPAWTHQDGDPGRTRWLDVPPIERAPTVRWRLELGDLELIDVAAVTPWGVVVVGFDRPRYETQQLVLDPRNGAVRHVERGTSELLGVDAGVVLQVVHGAGLTRALAAFDLVSLRELWRVELGSNPSPGHAHGALIVGGDDETRPLALVPLPDPRVAPALPSAWREVRVGAMTPRRAYAHEQRRLRDRRSSIARLDGGAIVDVSPWTWPLGVFRADERGVLVTGNADPALADAAVYDPDGAPLWRRADVPSGRDAVLGPAHVVLWWRGRAAHVVRRDTGQASTLLPAQTASVSGARDWVYACAGPTLVGARADGGATWTLDLEAGDLLAIAPAWGRRAIVVGDAGVVACVEQL